MRVVIVDSGGTNIASIQHACRRLGVVAELTAEVQSIRQADRVILPGVGSAAAAMQRLQQYGLVEVIRQLGQPVLGICLGMQLLYESSAEGGIDCLGLIPGRVELLQNGKQNGVIQTEITLPHMGWNQVQIIRPNSVLFDGISNQSHFYFVHGYAAPVDQYSIATCCHGEEFTAVCQRDNFIGIQCHPEKSGQVGAQFLENFLSGALN